MKTRVAKPVRWPPFGVLAASAVGAAFLLAMGAADRYVHAMLDRQVAEAGKFDVQLARLPLQFDSWTGKDLAMEENIIKATDTDDRVNRLYVEEGTNRAVVLYVAFGTRMRDMVPHRPQVCYPAGGWSHLTTETREIRLPNGRTVPCQVHLFERGVFDREQRIVLSYYVLNGRYMGDVEDLRRRVTMWGGERRYVAQVQISSATADVRMDEDDVERQKKMLVEFGGLTADAIWAQLPGIPAEGAS